MKVLEISSADVLGGAEGTAMNFFRGLNARGHDCWLGVGRKSLKDSRILKVADFSTSARRREKLRGLARRVPKPLRKFLEILSEPRNWLEYQLGLESYHYPGIQSLVAKVAPDLLHCHNLYGAFFDLRALAGLSQKLPVVVDVRDMWLLTGHCAHSFGCPRWQTGCGSCPDLKIPHAVKRDATAWNWRRKADIFGRSRLYITTSSHWMMRLVERSMLRPRKSRVIPHGIDLEVFKPGSREQARQRLGLPDVGDFVMFSARGGGRNPFKDYDTMIAALTEFARDYPGELHFLCLGADAGHLSSSGNVRIHSVEFQENPEVVADYYRASNLYLHGARAESFGKAVTEALACGIPTIASDVGGIPEQIESLSNGILVPVGDVRAMVEALRCVMRDPELSASLATRAVASARQFDLQRQLDDYLEWFDEVREDWKNFR